MYTLCINLVESQPSRPVFLSQGWLSKVKALQSLQTDRQTDRDREKHTQTGATKKNTTSSHSRVVKVNKRSEEWGGEGLSDQICSPVST